METLLLLLLGVNARQTRRIRWDCRRKKLKRLERNPWKKFNQVRENFKMCIVCSNPAGLKCEREMCKKCCRSKCFKENLACEQPGHRVFVRTSGGKTLREENGEVVRDEPVIS